MRLLTGWRLARPAALWALQPAAWVLQRAQISAVLAQARCAALPTERAPAVHLLRVAEAVEPLPSLLQEEVVEAHHLPVWEDRSLSRSDLITPALDQRGRTRFAHCVGWGTTCGLGDN